MQIEKQFRLSQKMTALVLVPLVFELIFVSVLSYLLIEADEQVARERHVTNVLSEANKIPRDLFDAGQGLAAFVLARSDVFKQKYISTVRMIPEELRMLEILVHENPRQRELLGRVLEATSSALEILDTEFQRAQSDLEPEHVMKSGEQKFRLQLAIDDIVKNIHELTSEERAVKQESTFAQSKNSQMIAFCLTAGVALNIGITVALAVFIHAGMTRRLKVLMENATRVTRKEPLEPVIEGDDEISRLDQVFHEMAGELDAADRYKKELMSMVGHDLRTPLTSVGVSVDLLLAGAHGEIDDKMKDELTSVRKGTRRLIGHINDLLSIERFEAGELALNKAPTSMRLLISSSTDSISALATKNGIHIRCPEVDYELNIDGDRITQVIDNLLSNAIKFSPKNSTVTIGMDSAYDYVQITVCDEGPGVPSDMQEKIFDRFQQIREDQVNPKAKEMSGSGLGLAICKSIVTAHGGKIGVESESGSGSTFWFRLPA